ncbi:hypothetical protein QTH97_00735 [Variovorax sp. J22R24]|uniref:hypothetical protein n=1 Tax=Variovorax gracilis TaxID=3053502 RepID=UPI002575D8C5|nr:hypothetical protein [Variovorax sp. J22R24]MDM0103438.1 hypothetical protein [Variovorax sp. J22R24]
MTAPLPGFLVSPYPRMLALSRPIPQTPMTWNLARVIGGDNRFGIRQDSKATGSMSRVF